MKHVKLFEDFISEVTKHMISGNSGRTISTLDNKKYELKKDVKGARIDDYIDVVLPKGTIIYNLPGGVFAYHDSLKKYTSNFRGSKWNDKYGVQLRSMPETLEDIEKNSKVLESVNNTVTFTIDDGNLDDKFLNDKSLSRNLDYKEDRGDTYYVLPKRDFDRFQDWADSSGFDIDEVIDIIEESVNEKRMTYKGRVVKRVWPDLGGDGKVKILLRDATNSQYVKPEDIKGYVNEAIAPLFPDVLKIKKDTKITSNANNERDVLPAGVYKSTGKEFDGMHIYKSKGKNWFLWPEDMDIINDMNESVSVSTMPYKSAHGKEPRGNGMWAFSVGGEDIFTPKAMNYGEALKWAKEEAKKRNASEIKVLG
jgi:hypothetical protein